MSSFGLFAQPFWRKCGHDIDFLPGKAGEVTSLLNLWCDSLIMLYKKVALREVGIFDNFILWSAKMLLSSSKDKERRWEYYLVSTFSILLISLQGFSGQLAMSVLFLSSKPLDSD